jgi:tetratricopeptide (TPR) repeat protein
MELTLAHQNETDIDVTCDGQHSHTFDVRKLLPNREKGLPHPLDDPMAYGKVVYRVLFPPESLARRELEMMPERILLVTNANDLDAIPWEYAYGPDGFLVLECQFVRGLPANQRIAPHTLESGLHIIAVPSNPLSHELEPLDIEGEWMRLKEIIQEVPFAITLERTRPPTIEQVRSLVANQNHRVIHFMGHGGQNEQEAFLCFEQDNGDLDPVTARQFALRVRDTVFLVTLNACVTATPGATGFSNLAAVLARQKVPYALGMRFSIPDDDARSFSRTFYSDLARASSVEEALLQARLRLANSPHPWVVGVPVLYTSLTQPAAGFPSQAGSPLIKDHQPHMEVSVLPRAEGTFQGRVDELKALGTALTGDSRPPLVTIHGAGGQGKTALAREGVERFSYAWSGGIWATSLENLPTRELFVSELARFLGIETQTVTDPKEVERLVLVRLAHRRTLIVLDNVETLIEAVEANNEEARRLAQFLKEQVPKPPVSLLATSRSFLGWAGEVGYELTGLAPKEGVRLFEQHAPQCDGEIDHTAVWELTEKVAGHPLSLQLLGSAFNGSTLPLPAYVKEYEEALLHAENKYKDLDHRQRTLYASIETSLQYLDAELADLFSRLWVFHAPFLPETVAAIFDPQAEDAEGERSPIYDRLRALWQRGLLTLETAMLHEGTVQFYRLLPIMRPYIETYLARIDDREQLLARFGGAYAQVVSYLYQELDRGSVAAFIAFQSREDLERGVSYVRGVELGYYLLYWGWILQRLIDTRRGLKLIEQALEIGQGQDRQLELQTLNKMATVYHAMGQSQRALELYDQALPIGQEVGDLAEEASILSNMAAVYQTTGQPQRALELYDQALPLMREVGDRAGEASILNNMAEVYQTTGQPQRALELYDQALPINQKVRDRVGEATILSNMAAVFRRTGQPERALELHEQALPIAREVGDRAGEASILNNMAEVYQTTGQLQQALELREQALPLMQEVENRAGEAVTLNDIARVYMVMGQPQRALELFEQALPIRQEVRDRRGEATTLHNMAEVFRITGQPERALELYEQALPIAREVGDRAGEASILHNMAEVFRITGQPERALELFKQALPIRRKVGDRAGEAITLNNMALVYQAKGQPQRALELFKQALPITREVGDREAEVATLNGLAHHYKSMENYGEAQTAFEQSILLSQQITFPAAEVAGMVGLSMLLYQHLSRPQEAIVQMEQAIALLVETGIPQDAAGHTRDQLQQYLAAMRQGISPDQTINNSTTIPAAQLRVIVANTITVMTTVQERRAEWRESMKNTLQQIQQQEGDWQNEVEFFNAVLALLDGKSTALPENHFYARALAQIQEGIAAGGLVDVETLQYDNLPFDAELVPRSIAALLGGPQEKMAHVQYLTTMSTQTTDEELKVLLQVIQLGLFGSDLSQLGQNLSGVYRQAWEAIVMGVETGGVDPRLFEIIIQNTLAVLGPAVDKRNEWRDELIQIKSKSAKGDAQELVALLDAVVGLLDAEGNPSGLGTNLKGVYARTWRTIIEKLPS